MRTLTQRINQYRSLETKLFCFPDNVKILDYSFYGVLQGERIDKPIGIGFFSFESISFIKTSVNAKNGKQFIHCKAYNGKELFEIILNEKV